MTDAFIMPFFHKHAATCILIEPSISGIRVRLRISSLTIRPRATNLATGRKNNAATPPPNVRLKAALPRDVNEKLTITVQSSYDHAVKLQCCIKIGKSEKIILFRTQWAIDFYVELYFASTDK